MFAECVPYILWVFNVIWVFDSCVDVGESDLLTQRSVLAVDFGLFQLASVTHCPKLPKDICEWVQIPKQQKNPRAVQ